MAENRTYIAIDLKSFFASVECKERKLDPLKTNLVVADAARTEKTICLAVTPSLKAYGIPGRARLFEVVQRVREENQKRAAAAPGHRLEGTSYDDDALKNNPSLAIDYVIAPPRMALYMKYSTKIYNIYLKYVAPETNITATAGIGTNLYLCKIAMDIVAKHVEPDDDGVRIAQLDEMQYRKLLWNHRPITDFWRVGAGYARKLEENGMYTMGDVARCSMGKEDSFYNEDLLYRLFGVNAELLIDHAWGYEPCTMEMIKAYRPTTSSLCSGQVLQCPYDFEKTRLVVQEMVDLQVLDLVDKGLMTDQVVLTIGYDIENLTDPKRRKAYHGEVTIDRYGRAVPKHAHGTINLKGHTSSTIEITEKVMELYDRIVDPTLLVRRINMSVNHLEVESAVVQKEEYEQLDLFTDYAQKEEKDREERQMREREKNMQHAMIDIKKKYGKNAIIKGMNLQEGATACERNRQIGGHKA